MYTLRRSKRPEYQQHGLGDIEGRFAKRLDLIGSEQHGGQDVSYVSGRVDLRRARGRGWQSNTTSRRIETYIN